MDKRRGVGDRHTLIIIFLYQEADRSKKGPAIIIQSGGEGFDIY